MTTKTTSPKKKPATKKKAVKKRVVKKKTVKKQEPAKKKTVKQYRPKAPTSKRGPKKKEIDLDKVERLAAIGLTKQQICDSLGIHIGTMLNRINENSKFSEDLKEAIKRGTAKGIAQVANNLFEQSKAGNVSAGIFFMKNRAGWRDNPVEDTPTETPSLNISFTVKEPVDDITITNAENIDDDEDDE